MEMEMETEMISYAIYALSRHEVSLGSESPAVPVM